MKLIQAVVDDEALPRVQEELNRVEVFRLSIGEVERRRRRETEAPRQTWESRPGVRLEIAVNEGFVKPTLDALYRALGGGGGIVYVLPLKDVVRIRTGERGPDAI